MVEQPDRVSTRGGRRPGAGRPRRLGSDEAILAATSARIRTGGLSAVTVDGVAADAGVSVGSIYRRWPSKTALVIAAYRDLLGPSEPSDTGSLRTDLDAVVEEIYTFFTGEHAKVLTALQTLPGDGDDVRTAIRESVAPRRASLATIVRRAVARGEISPDTDVELVLDMLVGPLWTRLLVTGRRITRPLIRRVIDGVCAAVSPAATSSP